MDPVLAARLAVPVGTEVELTYDFDTWAVPASIDADRVDVLVQGEAVAADPVTGAPTSLEVPLMLRADLDGGDLLFSTFHQSAQSNDLARDLLLAALADLPR